MELDKTKVIGVDSWNDIEALERETRQLLEKVRNQKPKKKDNNETKSNAKAQKLSRSNQSKDGKGKKEKVLQQSATVPLFSSSKYTVEVLDDAPPDLSPRQGGEDDLLLREKEKRAQLLKLERAYRTMSFGDEAHRVKAKKDLFVPSPLLSLNDVEQEQIRLRAIEASSHQKVVKMDEDKVQRSRTLKEERAALTLQAVYRGHLGRRRIGLMRYIEEASSAQEWVQIDDKETGDIWYYNKVTNKSQWEKPEALKTQLAETTKTVEATNGSNRQTADKAGTKTLLVSMSLPTLKAVKQPNARKVLAQSLSEKAELQKEVLAQQDVNKELKVDRIAPKDTLLAPDGTFKPHLRTVVLDALLDTRFDNVSTVLADTRWFDQNDEPFVQMDKIAKKKLKEHMVESRVDPSKAPMVSVVNLHPSSKQLKAGIIKVEPGKEGENTALVAGDNSIAKPSDLTFKDIAHVGFDAPDANNQNRKICFGCWSSGFNRKCSMHEDGEKVKPSQTMLLCRNWDLDVMRRRYRSEEIQEIFLQQESSLRFDVKHKKFYTVVEQRHPIYRLCSQQVEYLNNRMSLFCKVKFWLYSMAEEFRSGNVDADKFDKAKLMRIKRGLMHLSRIERFTAAHRSLLPLAPITGYSWQERIGEIQHLFKHLDPASGQEVDIIEVSPLPIPKKLYEPQEYHVSLPKTFPLPRAGASEKLVADGMSTLPANTFIPDLKPSAWMERISNSIAREGLEQAIAQVRALTPVTPLDLQTRSKRPAPSTMKFATIGQKATPGNLAVGGLPAELLIYQLISTFVPPQYGNFMIMDKASISPGVSDEVTIAFKSLLMPPTLEPYIERSLEHALNHRRAPTVCLNSNLIQDDKYYYGRNRPEQTGEQDPHGFRTTAWSPQLKTLEETDPRVFVPGQTVASLNVPKANLCCTTHADASYPFCEPSTRDNSTLDFYHLLLFSVVSMAKAQVFTALTVQEPGLFQKAYRLNEPLGHLVVSVYRSWAYRQQDTIQEFRTDDGISYWYHRKTGQTFWERPRYEEEEASPLQGGVIFDAEHDEEPMMMNQGQEGASRRYLQGDFRSTMLNHIETKKEAVQRRKAASVTVRNARERGIIPPIVDLESVVNHAAISQDLGLSRIDSAQPSSLLPNLYSEVSPTNQDGLPQGQSPAQKRQQQLSHDEGQMEGVGTTSQELMRYYAPPGQPQQLPGMVRGSNLDEGSALVGSFQPAYPSMEGGGANGQLLMPQSNQMQNNMMSAAFPFAMGGQQNQQPSVLTGFDNAIISSLTQTIGQMFSNMMSMDRANPQEMIQLGLGMGMALMQSGAVSNVAQNQIQAMAPPSFAPTSSEEKDDGAANAINIPSFAEDGQHSVFSQSQSVASHHSQPNGPASVTAQSGAPMGGVYSEPIGRVHPTAVLSSDRMLDHQEETRQLQEHAQQLQVPLNTMEKARNLSIEPMPSDTPDMVPVKAAAPALPTNAEQAAVETETVPLVAYPELSTIPPGGAPPTFTRKLPAGLGSRFVSKEEEHSQLHVPGATHLRRAVMPLPVGFFAAIEAKHVAKQAVDYLPQVPNFPSLRTIGRVKPRSAAADWLMISFDPWSAGRNPLNTEFVPSLMERADRLLKGADSKAPESMENMRTNVLGDAFSNIVDEAGLIQQKVDISKAQILADDFRKLCSLCRHGKFLDAEQLINQPDWAVPIDYQDEQGNALLHIASQNGSKRLIKLCLRRGASLNLQNLTGQTALHFAFGYGYNEAGEYLVSKGADDSIRNKDGLTCYEGLGARELALL
eukprot:gene903-984_t